jgi:hypothetical protein
MEFTYFKIQYQDLDNARDFFENEKHYGEFLVGLIDYYRTQNVPEFKTKMVQKYFSTYKKTADYVLGQRKLGVNGGKKRVENQMIKQSTLEGSVEGSVEPTLKDPLDAAAKPKLIKDNESKGKEIKINEIDGKPKNDLPIAIASSDFDKSKFIELFNSITGKRFRVLEDKAEKQLKKLFDKDYTKKDIISAIKNCMADQFHKENPNYLTPEFITREDKFTKYLCATPTKEQTNKFVPSIADQIEAMRNG